ncbi:MAG TPA: prolyl oligopeptidase family serine peptidase [Streptosporangiaceae bacterium]|nr:prolyl oligopeptidase family serine peptidase [Streptosporangiaceae bacterium]
MTGYGPGYPAAVRSDQFQNCHGLPVPDPYCWLEDASSQQTARWEAEQRILFEAERATWQDARRWEQELVALTSTDRVLTPKFRGDRIFLRRQRAGRDQPVLAVLTERAERELFDPLTLDPSGRTVLDAWEPSADGGLLAYQVSSEGTEDSLLTVLDVATGRTVDGPIDRVRRSPIAWLPDGRMFYYVRHLGDDRYHRQVFLHRLGTDPAQDASVFGDGRDKTEFYRVTVTANGRWLIVTASTGTSRGTSLYLADLSASPPDRPDLRPIQEAVPTRTLAHIGRGADGEDCLWLVTDHGAPRGRLVACHPDRPDVLNWREVIPERPGAVLENLTIVPTPDGGHPIGLVKWTRHAVSEATLHDLADGRELHRIPLPGRGSIAHFSVHPERGRRAWFLYTDWTTPPVLLCYDVATREVRPWPDAGQLCGQSHVQTQRDPVGLQTQVVSVLSRDGTEVRVFVVSSEARPTRPRPTILTGYGGFAASMVPAFRPEVLAWVRAGGVFALACLRGGGEEGREWHQAGRGDNKPNVFADFDAVTDYLSQAGWTSRDQLAIMGGSNGGLLVGVAITRHPEKYAAAVCMAPLLDMVRYEHFGLGPSWVPEYGSADDPAQLATLLSYSPYHHVTAGTGYPSVLLTASDGDTRVDPMHARKMCAALQYASTGSGPVLIRQERGVGHGTRARSSELALFADCLAFLGDRLKLTAGN